MGWEGDRGAWHTHTFPQPPADSLHLVRVSSLAVLTHPKLFCNADIVTSHKSGCQRNIFMGCGGTDVPQSGSSRV